MTPEQFKGAKPQFECLPADLIQVYLDLAALWVGDNWQDRLYAPATIAATCHLLTLDGYGDGAESQSHADGTAQFQTIKSGDVTLTRFAAAAGGASFSDWLGSTVCGRFLLQLMRMQYGGPRIAMGGVGDCVSTYAKDGWLYSWPGVFGRGPN